MIHFSPIERSHGEYWKGLLSEISLNLSKSESKIFDNKIISLVKVAKEANQTEYIFERLNQQYAIEVQQKSKLLSTLMEPMIIIVVDLFVGIILAAMYLPMIKLSSVVV